jgi:hypothetical protein
MWDTRDIIQTCVSPPPDRTGSVRYLMLDPDRAAETDRQHDSCALCSLDVSLGSRMELNPCRRHMDMNKLRIADEAEAACKAIKVSVNERDRHLLCESPCRRNPEELQRRTD